ncbi:hypothetical protein D0469_02305 [Peribacillus saganii]|uniref:Uncharacterized protein n=1 Tax=Peribacillus saganii TaxID=2303992 RepID=A0A372LUW5_9BACI|nr:hypothetical protein D0469_02305 [Peribacillus saganii]
MMKYPLSTKAQASWLAPTIIRQALTEGAFCLPKRLEYDLEGLDVGAKDRPTTFVNFIISYTTKKPAANE